MKNLKNTLLILITLFSTLSCGNDNDPTNNVCDENYFSDLITTAFSNVNGYNDFTTMDTETHQYTLKINANGVICSVGYQNPSTYNGGYIMKITNVTSGNTYSGVHSFSQSGIDYQPITPISVSNGDIIEVKRTVLPGYTLFSEIIGGVMRKTGGGNIPYPITEGNVTFLSSSFYGAGGPVYNLLQPNIVLGFNVN